MAAMGPSLDPSASKTIESVSSDLTAFGAFDLLSPSSPVFQNCAALLSVNESWQSGYIGHPPNGWSGYWVGRGPDGYRSREGVARILFGPGRTADWRSREVVDDVWIQLPIDGKLKGKYYDWKELLDKHSTRDDQLRYRQVHFLRDMLCDESLYRPERRSERIFIEETLNYILDDGLQVILRRLAEDEAVERICKDRFAVRITLITDPRPFLEIWRQACLQSPEDVDRLWNMVTTYGSKLKVKFDKYMKLVMIHGNCEDKPLFHDIQGARRVLCYNGLYVEEHRNLLMTIRESINNMMDAGLQVIAIRLMIRAEPELGEFWEKAKAKSEEDVNRLWNMVTADNRELAGKYYEWMTQVTNHGRSEDGPLYNYIQAARRLLCDEGLYVPKHYSLLTTIRTAIHTMMDAGLSTITSREVAEQNMRIMPSGTLVTSV